LVKAPWGLANQPIVQLRVAPYLKAIALDTSQRGPYLQLSRLYSAKREWEKIESLLKRMVLTPGAKPQKYTDLARFYEGQKKYDQTEQNYLVAISIAPEAVFPLMNLAEYYVRRDSRKKALETMHKALAKKKNDPLTLTGLAQIYMQFEMIEESEEVIDRVLQHNSKYTDALYLKGRILMHKKDFAGAMNKFDSVIKIDKYNARAYYFRAQCIKRRGAREVPEYNLQKAAAGLADDPESFERSQAKESLLAAVLIDPDFMDARIKLTEIYLEEKNSKKAKEQIEKVLNAAPRSLKALTLMAGVKILEGDLKGSEEICKTVLGLRPDYVPGHIRLGVLYKSMGQNEKALKSFEKALELSPQETGILKLIADIYIDEQRFDDAFDIINKYKEPGNPTTSALVENMKGEIFLETGQPDRAAQHFRNAIAAAPEIPDSYMRLAGIVRQHNQISEALALYQKVEEINPSHQPALMAIGYIFDIREDFKKAEKYYRKILELNPEHALAANNLAFIIAEKEGDIEQAYKLALFAREKRPRDPNVLDTIGWIYYKKGSYLSAVSELEGSLKLKQDNPLANFHLAMALYRLRKFERSRTHLKKALEQDPDFRGADIARSMLR